MKAKERQLIISSLKSNNLLCDSTKEIADLCGVNYLRGKIMEKLNTLVDVEDLPSCNNRATSFREIIELCIYGIHKEAKEAARLVYEDTLLEEIAILEGLAGPIRSIDHGPGPAFLLSREEGSFGSTT